MTKLKTLRALDDAQIIALLYRRVSSKEQKREGLSLAAQLNACHEYSARKLDWVAGEEFEDVQTGRKVGRSGYQSLLTAVRAQALAGRRVVVVVARVDRLGRNMEESARAWKELAALGAEVHSVREGGLVTWQTFHILAFIAEDESRRIGGRVRDVWAEMEQHGWHRPGRVAWGYAYRKATDEERGQGSPGAVLVPDAVHAAYARELWMRYAGGECSERLIRWAALLPAAAKGPRTLGGSAIRELLRLPVYVGRLGGAHDIAACVEDGGRCEVLDEPRGRWEPLIDDETWERAHEQYRRARRLPAQASGQYLLTGLLRCHACGGRMVGNPGNRKRAERDNYRGDPRDLQRYVCSERLHGDARARATPCYATVQARKVEGLVIATVREMLLQVNDPELAVRYRAKLRREAVAAGGADGDAGLVSGLERKLAATKQQLLAASQRYFVQEISKLTYQIHEEELGREIEAIAEEIARVRSRKRRPEVMAPDAMLRLVDSLSAVARELAKTEGSTLRWRGLLEPIVAGVTPVRLGRGVYEATVGLTPFGRGLLEYVCEGTVSANLVAVQQLGTTNCRTTPLPPTALSA